jgi:pimeloyl-ACP methyl ester carboxylesterase
MKYSIKYVAGLVIMLAVIGCENEKRKTEEVPAKQEEMQKEIQKQLLAEFGEYNEVITTEGREYFKSYNKALTLWNTAFHELNIPTSLGNAHVIVCGPKNGEPVVLLHGMNASSTMWYPNIKALSQNHRVYAIDYLLEPGKSHVKGEVKDMSEIVNWYNEIFDQLKLDEFSLIGASRGGWLAMYFALQQTSRIRSIVLLSPAQTFMWIPPGSEVLSGLNYTIRPKRKHLRRLLETMSFDVDKIEQEFIDQYFLATQEAIKIKFILKMTPYTDDELKRLTMPVLLLIGNHDIINTEKSIEQAEALLPYCETGIIKNAGHFLSIDQSDTVNARILEFLDEPNTAHVK